MKCNKCGQNINDDAKYCPYCGESLIKVSKYNIIILICACISVIISFFAIKTIIALIGIIIGFITLTLSLVNVYRKNKERILEINLGLSIVGIISNFGWLAYILWILPTL